MSDAVLAGLDQRVAGLEARLAAVEGDLKRIDGVLRVLMVATPQHAECLRAIGAHFGFKFVIETPEPPGSGAVQ